MDLYLNAAHAQPLRIASVTTLSSVLRCLCLPLPSESHTPGPSSVCSAIWFVPWYPGLLSLYPSTWHPEVRVYQHFPLGGLQWNYPGPSAKKWAHSVPPRMTPQTHSPFQLGDTQQWSCAPHVPHCHKLALNSS